MSVRRPFESRAHIAAVALAPVIAAAIVFASMLSFRAAPARAATTTVQMGGYSYIYSYYWFCGPSYTGNVCQTVIQTGDTVTWQNVSDTAHTTTECDSVCGGIPGSPLWDSGPVAVSGMYSHTFNTPGVYNYQCNLHPTQMKGQIVVQAPSTPTPPATITPTPTPTPQSVGGISIDPSTGLRASARGGGSTWLWALAGTVVLAMSAAWWAAKAVVHR